MIGFTDRRNLWGNLANTTLVADLAFADQTINIEEKRILSSRGWPFLEKQFTLLTDSSNQFKALPQYVDRVSSVYVTIGSFNYSPRECPSRGFWDWLNMSSSVTSDTPQWWFVYDGKLGLWPKPATSSNVITVNSKRLARDLTIADYTTGGILTTVVGSTTITGTGTTFTASMVGRYLRITESDTANKGDGFWYEILSYTSATVINTVRAYAGTAITTGNAAYTISQCSLLPEQYQDLPIYGSLRTYFTSRNPDPVKAQFYQGMYNEMYHTMETDYLLKNESYVIDDGIYDDSMINPNLTILE